MKPGLHRFDEIGVPTVIEVFTFELHSPTNVVNVNTHGQVLLSLALSEGKVVEALGLESGGGIYLTGQRIDTVILYAVAGATPALSSLEICINEPEVVDSWAAVPYLVRGLTLPIREADVSLVTYAQEVAAAQSRLVGAETITPSEFSELMPSLRLGASHTELGRAADRILLMRSTNDQPWEEVSFDAQLQILQIAPRIRGALGFRYHDRGSNLSVGAEYEYRVTGWFHAEDLFDDVYDFHRVPSQTLLPSVFRIRGAVFRFSAPAQIVLDPAPGAPVLDPNPVEGRPEISARAIFQAGAGGTSSSLLAISRRGVRIDGTAPPDPSWSVPQLGSWTLVVDLPRPVTTVVLDVGATHTLSYAGGNPGDPFVPVPLPPGTTIPLTFATPITQLRLSGVGTLFMLRLPDGRTGIVPYSVETGTVSYDPSYPPPEPPTAFQISNLQQPPIVLTGVLDESTQLPASPPPGFLCEWLPAVAGVFSIWPTDLDAEPPIDAMYFQIEHHTIGDAAGWEPVVGGDNITLGSGDETPTEDALQHGADLDAVYPRVQPVKAGGILAKHCRDMFGGDPTPGFVRSVPPFGTSHEYRIRTVDPVGRVSATWTLSNTERLEKHTAPPLPVAPPLPDPDTHVAAADDPHGVRARVYIAGNPNLTSDALAILGGHANAIVLDWGWRPEERNLDGTVREFRIYRCSRPFDSVPGQITAVAVAPGGGWNLTFTTDRWLQADECAGQWITSDGHPFAIVAHGVGHTVIITVKASSLTPPLVPIIGPASFGRPLRPEHRRPAWWDERVHVEPLAGGDHYSYTFYDLLTLTADKPLQTVWVGVSSADGEPYVDDELPPWVPNGDRFGNESSIAVATATGRYRGRPAFSASQPPDVVPELLTEEPGRREVIVSLDLVALLPGALPPNEPIALDRCDSETLLGLTQSSATIDNAAFMSLAKGVADPDQIFQRTTREINRFGVVQDRLPPKAGRYLYRVRRADVLGNVSTSGAILPCVVRVPSVAPAVLPERTRFAVAVGTAAEIDLQIEDDEGRTTHALLFQRLIPFTTGAANQSRAELLRIPNRPDLYPGGGIHLLAPDGTLLSPLVKALSDADVTLADDMRSFTITITPAGTGWLQCWCAGVTRDGMPSPLAGPFTIAIGGA